MEKQNESNPAKGENWQHLSGKNGKHQSRSTFAVLRPELDAIEAKLADIRSNPYKGCAKIKRKLERQRRHIQQQLGKRGEEHNRIAKGLFPRRR